MSEKSKINRRDLLSIVGAGIGMGIAGQVSGEDTPATVGPDPKNSYKAGDIEMPYGMLGKTKISRMMLGGNLIGGWMHSRDLKYVNSLFRAYATEDKMIETLAVAEANGINTVFETGANFIERYNRECNGKMQFIPHIKVESHQTELALKDHIQQQVDTGACALYVWGVAGDTLVRAGAIDQLKLAVELAKRHDLPIGVGGHSLQVPIACEKADVPCDFYVKTYHEDNYPSATPKEHRKDFAWLDGENEYWYDNMWCINPEETVEFMKSVKKPWVAFKNPGRRSDPSACGDPERLRGRCRLHRRRHARLPNQRQLRNDQQKRPPGRIPPPAMAGLISSTQTYSILLNHPT